MAAGWIHHGGTKTCLLLFLRASVSPWSVLVSKAHSPLRYVRRRGRELRIRDALVVADGLNEALAGDLAVPHCKDSVGGIEALLRTPVVVHLGLFILLPRHRVAHQVALLDRQVGEPVDGERYRLVLAVDDGDLVHLLVLGESETLIDKRRVGLLQPDA